MKILQLGCGINPLIGAVNHDKIRHSEGVDVAWDLDVTPWLWNDGEFDKVMALDAMEHLKVDVEVWLDECWRILQPDGLLVLRLPAWDHENSHIDPTHRRLFHEHTFDYWDRRTAYFANYGVFYFPQNKWWTVESVERRDNNSNIAYVLRKQA